MRDVYRIWLLKGSCRISGGWGGGAKTFQRVEDGS